MTVHEATYNLLRALDLTTIFGNPGSTEQPFLKNFRMTFNTSLDFRRRRQWRWPMDSHKRRKSLCW
jgi:thiamine pyrophosphate-dependent acetolactate synthase large subunit-like protein